MHIERVERKGAHPLTGLRDTWIVTTENGESAHWDGFHTGPLTLKNEDVSSLCEELLGIGMNEMRRESGRLLRPVPSDGKRRSQVLLHSTTPDLKAFEGDLESIRQGVHPHDFTTYKEARSPYLAGPGDLAVGRTRPWQATAAARGVEALVLPDSDHYYLSHALLHLTQRHRQTQVPEIAHLIERFRQDPETVVSLYAFEDEFRIFLLWLLAEAELEVLFTDTNPPAIAAAWNRKDVLHPTVEAALRLPAPEGTRQGAKWLALESAASGLQKALGFSAPVFPGYTLERQGTDISTFVLRTLEAAQLLGSRHGLEKGCLKPSEAGDGARITTGIDLEDEAALAELAKYAWPNGDDYLLEAHIQYLGTEIDGEAIHATPSAHIRGGRLDPGLTLQFMRGTSWKGNIYVDDASAESVGLPVDAYRMAREAVEDLDEAFRRAGQGLISAGIDIGIGRLGGSVWGDAILAGIQDLNISFTGANCLRAYMDRQSCREGVAPFAASKVVRPHPSGNLQSITDALRSMAPAEADAQAIAMVPDRWGMIAARGENARQAAAQVLAYERGLQAQGLVVSF